MSRMNDILAAVSECVRRIDHWLLNLRPGDRKVLTEDVALGIKIAAVTCANGDIPEHCRELCTIAVPKLNEELHQYEREIDGKVQPDGSPSPAFWSAAKAVAVARMGADQIGVERLEPVALLLKQGVSPEQIAFHIYGFRGNGPFVQANGAVDTLLIEQEAAQPGSVIKPDWIHPSKRQAVMAKREEAAKRLEAYDALEAGPKTDRDPSTIEGMLRDGCYVQQIEKYKGVSRDEILEVAKKHGLKAIDGPAYVPPLAMKPAAELIGTQQAEPTEAFQAFTEEAEAQGEAEQSDAIVSLSQQYPDLGAPEIAAKYREGGGKIAAREVSRILARHAKHATV